MLSPKSFGAIMESRGRVLDPVTNNYISPEEMKINVDKQLAFLNSRNVTSSPLAQPPMDAPTPVVPTLDAPPPVIPTPVAPAPALPTVVQPTDVQPKTPPGYWRRRDGVLELELEEVDYTENSPTPPPTPPPALPSPQPATPIPEPTAPTQNPTPA
jgi:hypothetical protein